jgi:hypothetical protein
MLHARLRGRGDSRLRLALPLPLRAPVGAASIGGALGPGRPSGEQRLLSLSQLGAAPGSLPAARLQSSSGAAAPWLPGNQWCVRVPSVTIPVTCKAFGGLCQSIRLARLAYSLQPSTTRLPSACPFRVVPVRRPFGISRGPLALSPLQGREVSASGGGAAQGGQLRRDLLESSGEPQWGSGVLVDTIMTVLRCAIQMLCSSGLS